MQNVKAHLISMWFLAKQILAKYKSLLVYKFDDQTTNSISNSNLGLWFDVQSFLSLSCILPLFECMQAYSKFIHSHDVFIYVFIDAIKACERDLYKMYVNLIMSWLSNMDKQMFFFKSSLLLWITLMITHGLDFLNLSIVWNMWDFNFLSPIWGL